MRRPFDGSFLVTQTFNDSCCQSSYFKFGLKGHNGYDYGVPTGTPIVAPHNGKVLEATFDPSGYGNYVKVDNGTEGSVLAHLKNFVVSVNQEVKEGDLLGYSNNTGNSTAPHLHWGYYRIPRDRGNGFAGFVDQDPYLKSSGGTTPPTPQPPMNDVNAKKASGLDRIWTPFKFNGKTPEQAEEKDHLQFVEWIKSNVSRAGKWDQLVNKAGFSGNTDAISVDQLFNKIKGNGDVEKFRAKVIDFVKSVA